MDEAIDCGERHGLIWKYPPPLSKGLVRRDQRGAPFVPGADEFEQHACFGLILGDIGDVVEDEQMILVELGDCGLELEFLARCLEFLDEIGRPGEENPPSILDERGQVRPTGVIGV